MRKLNIGSGSDYLDGWVNLDRFENSEHHRNECRFDVQADGHTLPFGADSFERVRCRHVLEHLERPLDALREMHRVLIPGGTVYLEVPNPTRQPEGVGAERKSWHRMHLYSWTPGSLERICDRAGFTNIEYHADHPESQPRGHAVLATKR